MQTPIFITALCAVALFIPSAWAQAPALEATALAQTIVASHGGADKLLRTAQ